MQYHASRDERKKRVTWSLASDGPVLTAAQLAKKQGLTKSPNFVAILEEMVKEGSIIVQWGRGSNRQWTRYFSLPSQAPVLEGLENA